MEDRLKQIWSGFEAATSRRLTGRGVDNIIVPSRQRWDAENEEFLSEDFVMPSAVAFETLKARLKAKEKKLAKGKRRRGETGDTPPPMGMPASNGEMQAAKDLVRGLMSTEARVARSDYDYVEFLDEMPAKRRLFGRSKPRKPKAAGRRKKFLGIF